MRRFVSGYRLAIGVCRCLGGVCIVYLVADDEQAMLLADVHNMPQLILTPDTPVGLWGLHSMRTFIVFVLSFLFQVLKINGKPAMAVTEPGIYGNHACIPDGIKKWFIGRGMYDDAVSGPGNQRQGMRQSGHHA